MCSLNRLFLCQLTDSLDKEAQQPYIIYAQIGFSTNRQTFNNNIATAEKSPIFTVHKS